MELRSLFRTAGKHYFDHFELHRVWQTADQHGLALLTNGHRRYVLKSPFPYSRGAFYARSLRSMRATARYLSACGARDLPVAPFLPNKLGELVTALPGPRYCYLTEWVPHVEAAPFPSSRHRSLAAVQARLHQCAATLSFAGLRRHFLTEVDFRASLQRLETMSSPLGAKLHVHGVAELAHLHAAWSDVPTGICHNDLGAANLLVHRSGAFTVIDFDCSDLNYFASDLARTIGYLCRNETPDRAYRLIGCYIASYQRYRRLSRAELRILGAVLVYAGFLTYPYVRRRMDDARMLEWLRAIRAAGIPAGPDDLR